MIAQCARNSALPAPVCSGCSVWSTLRSSVFSARDWIGFLRRDLAVRSCSCDVLRHLDDPCLALVRPAGTEPTSGHETQITVKFPSGSSAVDSTQSVCGFEQTRQSVTVYGYCCVFSRAAVNINGGHFRHLPPHCTALRLGAICLVCRPKCVAGGNGPLASRCGGCVGGGRILAFAHASFCAVRSLFGLLCTNRPLSRTASLVGGRISCFLACRPSRRPSPPNISTVAVSIL